MSRRNLAYMTAAVSVIMLLSFMASIALAAKPTPTIVLTFINVYTKRLVTDSPIGVQDKDGNIIYCWTDSVGKATIENTGQFILGQTYEVKADIYGDPEDPGWVSIGSFTVKSNGGARELIWYDIGM